MEKSNPTGPAEELRAAATLIRETAKGTTPTPWRVHLRYYRKSPDTLAGAEFETPLHTSGISLKYPHLLADTRWKALMSPAVAEHLFRWLTDAANDMAGAMVVGSKLPDAADPIEYCDEPDSVRAALAFARSILGRAS